MAVGSTWIDTVLARAAELRKAGVLSIEVDGCAAVFAPAEPGADEADAGDAKDEAAEPASPWDRGESYPTGRAPSLGQVDKADDLPEIPTFGDG